MGFSRLDMGDSLPCTEAMCRLLLSEPKLDELLALRTVRLLPLLILDASGDIRKLFVLAELLDSDGCDDRRAR